MKTRNVALLAAAAVLTAQVVVACGDDNDSSSSSNSTQNGNGGAGVGGAGNGGTTTSNGGGGSGPTSGPGGGGAGPSNADCSAPSGSDGNVALQEVANGYSSPMLVTYVPGDDDHIYIVERAGTVIRRNLDSGDENQFMDISGVVQLGGENGLLGLAFHPDYQNNGRVFVHYNGNGNSVSPGDSIIEEYARSGADPTVVDPNPVQTILTQSQPANNHNGGSIEFSPADGHLYIGFGDGGGANDQFNHGQNVNSLLAAVLRLDVDGGQPYAIPDGNLQGGLPEIYDYGLRNPYRFAFDPCTGDFYIGDVGQNAFEEVDVVAPGPGGRNWGWSEMEGNNCFGGNCDMTGLSLPSAVYQHGQGLDIVCDSSITGGVVYRATGISWLRGSYFFADFCDGRVWRMRWDGNTGGDVVDVTQQLIPGWGPGNFMNISSFGQDNRGEVYVVDFSGTIYRIVEG